MTEASSPRPELSKERAGNPGVGGQESSSGANTLGTPSTLIQTRGGVPGPPNLGMSDQHPLPYEVAARAVIQCIRSSVRLLLGHHLRQPRDRAGMQLRFADGTSASVYRETVLSGHATQEPCVLFVAFRLRLVRGWGHAVFRAESLLNTPLFVGFPGFVSKLWMANDERGVYRGVYQWDGSGRAEHYARSLWRVLALGSVPGSIHYMIVPGLHRDEVLDAPQLLDVMAPKEANAWWRVVGVS